MNTSFHSFIAACVFAVLTTLNLSAATHYVWQSSPGPAPPYTNWTTAATNIQLAVDAAATGDEIVVTNGTYAGGSRVDPHGVTNRVVVTKPLVLRSVNGPQATVINGDWGCGCVYLTNGATLFGFTLTNGHAYGGAMVGGGVYCASTSAVVSNCVLTGNWAAINGGGASGGTLNNCMLTGNSASWGGGAYNGTLNNCTLSGNWAAINGGGACGGTLNNCTLTGNSSASWGGGAYNGTLNNCTLTGNSATNYGGGGASEGTLNNCTLAGNSANYGGGASGGTLNNCTLTGNSANGYYDYVYGYVGGFGGGADSSTLNNCALTGNTASDGGGGASEGTLNNCTLTGNSGWGASSATLNNCIVYFNSGPNGGNYDPSSTLNYCCTTPLPTSGVGNIGADPQLASASHLSATSPCRGAGSARYASGTDIDGEAWANPPSIGCDEYHAGAVTGPLTVSLTATLTNVATSFPVSLTAFIEGRTDLSVWEFGDGLVEVNEPYPSHAWTVPGDYRVALWAFNDSYPGGVSTTLTVHVEEGLQYVAATSGNPVAPYTSWTTAATNIQDAVDVAPPGGTVFVTNGTYTPVKVSKPLVLRSVNGPEVTVIDGGGAARCLFLANEADMMVGFTLTNGVASGGLFPPGGGVYCESASAVLSNCVLSGNSANVGGGAYGGTLNNCTLTGNWGFTVNAGGLGVFGSAGGGADSCTLNNCTLSGNSAWGNGGGACGGTLNHCTLTGNSANIYDDDFGGFGGGGGGGADGATLNNCTLTGNSANVGGGTCGGTLNNCALTGNTANGWALNAEYYGSGGGAESCTLNNCMLTGNSASDGGGGAHACTLNNCIVYFNSDPNGGNYDPSSTLNYCCTTPMPTNGGRQHQCRPATGQRLASECRIPLHWGG